MSENRRESDFERESSRLNEGLKTCRAVMDNYRSMIAGEQTEADNDESEMSGHASTTESAADANEGDSATN